MKSIPLITFKKKQAKIAKKFAKMKFLAISAFRPGDRNFGFGRTLIKWVVQFKMINPFGQISEIRLRSKAFIMCKLYWEIFGQNKKA